MADRKWFLLYFLISFLLQCAPSLQDCPPPNVDSNVIVTPDQPFYSSYTYALFSCPDGYSATNGSTYSYCYPGSYWFPDMSQVISCTLDTDVTTPATGNVSAKAMVFVADKSLSKIFMADFSSGDFESLTFTALPIGSVNQPLDVDYDPQTRMVYWSDMAGTIRRANIDGTMQSVILDSSVGRAEGIALDSSRGKIFWTDETYDRIMSANLDGSNVKTLINTDISNPRAIVIHKNMRVMFWTDWSYPGRIERANLDGGDRYVIVNSTVVWPNGLDLNSYGGRIYWCDASTDKIESSDLWGNYRETHLSTSSIHPYDLAFVNDYTLAWTDWNLDSIGLTSLYDNNYTFHYSDTFQNPYGIHVTPSTSCQECCECGGMGGCYCDSVCQEIGDCCHDYVQFCNDSTPTPQPTGQWDTDSPESTTDSWWQPQTTPWWWWNTDRPESTTENGWQPQTTPWWWWNTDRPEYTTENRWQPQTTPWWWWNTDRPTPDGPDYTTWMWGTPNLPVVGEENVTLAVGVTQIISSHNYPSNHPNNVRYNWYITAPPGYDVIVDFLDFKLESCCDFLRIGIGESPSSPGSATLATLTGSSLPSDMRLYSSPSWMMFYTDISVTNRGFQLRLSLTNENTAITTESPNTRWWWWTTTDYPAITTDSPNTRWWWWTTDYPGTTDSPLQPNETARLVNGSYSSEGRVEVYHSGTWGTVCDHAWDAVDAGVLCRSIGYPNAVRSHGSAFYGMGDGPILLNHVGCYGYEDSLFDCYHQGVGVHHCSHDEDAGAVCYPDARLVNGDDPSEGRLEVYYDGVWGTVCDHSWYSANSYVVCRSLGFPGYIGHVYNAYFGQGTGPILLNHVTCMGDEGSIFDCSHYGVGNNHCYHYDDIGIRCLQNVRLVNGTTPAEGRLEVFHGESWGTVCDHGWGLDEADVVCRSLGYSSAEVVFYNAYFGEGSGDILLNHVYCTGNESSIFYCSHDGVGVNHCNHYDDVGIRCADGVTTDPAPITTTVSFSASTPYWDIWTTSVPFEGEENVTLAVGQPQIIASPNYPWNYPNNVYYNWYITAPSGYDVLVEFLVFDLEWDYDYLLIGTGESRSSPGSVMLAALTGTSNPGYMRLNSSESWMLFSTDSSVTDTGFQLRLSLVYAAEDSTTNPPLPDVTDTPISTVRLVNGGGAHEGRVEVYHDGLWGTVCDDYWDMVDARVVCRSLGYSDASSAPQHAHFGYGNDPIWMDNVHCAGYEEHIFDCPHNGFGNHNCGHHEDASVICIPDQAELICDSVSMTLIMDRSLLEIGDNARDVHFIDESCVGYDHDSQHVAITTMYNRCGTKQEQDEENVIFTNTVTFYKPNPENGTIITREHYLHIPVTCNLKRTQVLGESFLPQTEEYVFDEEGYGEFSLRMERYTSSNFQTPANDSGLVTLRTPLYFGIHLASVTNLTLLIESCWATGSSDPMDDHRYDIIENGCAVDSTTYIYAGFPATFKAFTIAAFAFIGDYDRVYVHCSILICDNNDSGSRCTQGCLSRSRRDLQPAGYRSKPHTITSGPLSDASRSSRAMLLDTADGGPEYHDPLMIVSVSALCVLFSLTVIMALVIVRMRRHRRPELIGYQRVDTTE